MAFEGLQQGILGLGQGIAGGITQNWMREQQLKQQEWENKLAKERLKLSQDYFQFQLDQENYQRQKDAEAAQVAAQERAKAEYDNRIAIMKWLVENRGYAQAPTTPEGVTPYPGLEPHYEQDIYNVGLRPQQGTVSRQYQPKETKPVPETPVNVQRFLQIHLTPNISNIPEGETPEQTVKNQIKYLKANLGKDVMHSKDYADTINHLNEWARIERYNANIDRLNRQKLGEPEEITRLAPLSTQQVQRKTVQIPNIITAMQETEEEEPMGVPLTPPVLQSLRKTFRRIHELGGDEYFVNLYANTPPDQMNEIDTHLRQMEDDLRTEEIEWAKMAKQANPNEKPLYQEVGADWTASLINAGKLMNNSTQITEKWLPDKANKAKNMLAQKDFLPHVYSAWMDGRPEYAALAYKTRLKPFIDQLLTAETDDDGVVTAGGIENPFYDMAQAPNEPERYGIWHILPYDGPEGAAMQFLRYLDSL